MTEQEKIDKMLKLTNQFIQESWKSIELRRIENEIFNMGYMIEWVKINKEDFRCSECGKIHPYTIEPDCKANECNKKNTLINCDKLELIQEDEVNKQ